MEKTDKPAKDKTVKIINQQGPMGFVLFVAWIGALVYFVHQSSDFWGIIVAFLKACVWPAFVVYHGLAGLGA